MMMHHTRTYRPSSPCANCNGIAGFTLIEMIITIVITGILAGIIAVFIVRPMQGYVDLGRRAALVDAAESALRRMARDIRIALPNSVRVTNNPSGIPGFALEMIPTLDAGKYTTGGNGGNRDLGFGGGGDDNFDIWPSFHNPAFSLGTFSPRRLVVNNRGTTGNDVYADASIGAGNPSIGVITPKGITITLSINGINQHIAFSNSHKFKSSSPDTRIYVVQTPVSYLCNETSGTLTRYANYDIQTNQPVSAATLNALPGVTSALVTDHVSNCSITTLASTIRSRGLATLDLTLSDQGEQIRLIQQVQLDNSR
ncbi:MAG: prepilin-type N-terminal cleavage/methylation domain-containing protein [Pseudomonadota bacterium]